jgi:hypothetical protein
VYPERGAISHCACSTSQASNSSKHIQFGIRAPFTADMTPNGRANSCIRTVHIWVQVVHRGDAVVDATCGNGKDTKFLAQLVGSTGTVHAFDVQATALDRTRAEINAMASIVGSGQEGSQWDPPSMHYHLMSHELIGQQIKDGSVSLVAFNLGYLPQADHSILTSAQSTTTAVCAALQVRTMIP